MTQQTNPAAVGATATPVAVAAAQGGTPAVQAEATVSTVVPADTDTPKVEVKRSAAADFLDDETTEPVDDLSPETAAELARVFGDAETDDTGGDTGGDEGEVVDTLDAEGNADLADLEDLSFEEDSSAVIEVCKKKCLECKALVPWAEKTYKQCHFSNGNEYCPAKSIQIRTRIPFEQILPNFFAMEERNDSKGMLTFYQKLEAKELWQQEAIHDAIKAERSRRMAR